MLKGNKTKIALLLCIEYYYSSTGCCFPILKLYCPSARKKPGLNVCEPQFSSELLR